MNPLETAGFLGPTEAVVRHALDRLVVRFGVGRVCAVELELVEQKRRQVDQPSPRPRLRVLSASGYPNNLP
jgi:hypothetical protein